MNVEHVQSIAREDSIVEVATVPDLWRRQRRQGCQSTPSCKPDLCSGFCIVQQGPNPLQDWYRFVFLKFLKVAQLYTGVQPIPICQRLYMMVRNICLAFARYSLRWRHEAWPAPGRARACRTGKHRTAVHAPADRSNLGALQLFRHGFGKFHCPHVVKTSLLRPLFVCVASREQVPQNVITGHPQHFFAVQLTQGCTHTIHSV
jgi:hypothetical protein